MTSSNSGRMERSGRGATDTGGGQGRGFDAARINSRQPSHSPDISSHRAPESRTPQDLTAETYTNGAMDCLRNLCCRKQPRNSPDTMFSTLPPSLSLHQHSEATRSASWLSHTESQAYAEPDTYADPGPSSHTRASDTARSQRKKSSRSTAGTKSTEVSKRVEELGELEE